MRKSDVRRSAGDLRTTGHGRESGQAMVEFVIVLIFIMAMVVGMVATMRLLTFQFWAQQEARFLAFEQTWAAKSHYDESGDTPEGFLTDGQDLGRPQLVTDRDTTREVADDEGERELLASLWRKPEPRDDEDEDGVRPTRSAPTMLARAEDSIWNRKTSEWFGPDGVLGGRFSVASTAVAREVGHDRSARSTGVPIDQQEDHDTPAPFPEGFYEKLEDRVQTVLQRGGFGETFCQGAQDVLPRHGFAGVKVDKDCASRMDRDFAHHIAATVEIPELYREYGMWIDEGLSPKDAVQRTLRDEAAQQFYSFYDLAVKTGQQLAPLQLVADRIDAADAFLSGDFLRLGTDFRYIGSAAAIAAIAVGAGTVTITNPLDRNPQSWKTTEDNVNEILHLDAAEVLPFSVPYFLNPTYLPVPPIFGSFGASLQESVMRQALFEEDDLQDPLIDQSNKMVEVATKASGGLFTPALKIPGVENPILKGKFYLVTQEWHILRRPTPSSDYRDKGDQFDDIGEDTEEGILRRRVSGLWLFPSDFAALLEPISAIPGLSFLSGVVSVLEPLSSIIGEIKSFILDNPLTDIVDALSEIPGFGSFVPTLPKWPVVRPDAYPGSNELVGNSADDPDKLMGADRQFSDYVDEQREFNPPPNPVFNDD